MMKRTSRNLWSAFVRRNQSLVAVQQRSSSLRYLSSSLAGQKVTSSSGTGKVLSDQELEHERKLNLAVFEYSQQAHQTISMKQLIQFGSNVSTNSLLEGARWLHRELQIRLAKQVKYLNEMPKGLNLMPSVKVVREWYMESFKQICETKIPKNYQEQLEFVEVLQDIYERHAPTAINVAKGVHELKLEYAYSVFKSLNLVDLSQYGDLHNSLDNFYINRIGMRTLIGQHLQLQKQFLKGGNDKSDYVGLICLQTSPRLVALDAIEDAKQVCLLHHMDAPEVIIEGRPGTSHFPYVPSHLYYVLFELLKNSMRAVSEKHKHADSIPPIHILLGDEAENEDICIKVSDQGGGISRSNMNKIWSYLYTTGDYDYEQENSPDDRYHVPLAGLGYGLPLSRVYTEYWGGSLQLLSVEGYGSDVYIYLPKHGDHLEPRLPE